MMRCIVLFFVVSSAASLVRGQTAQRVERFAPLTAELQATGQYANPYTEVSAEATLSPPSGAPRKAHLFWDGGANWKLRFSPDLLGVWKWTVKSSDMGLDGKSGGFECVDSGRHGSIRPMNDYPLHFERQDGSPFWFSGDTAWALFTDSAEEKHDQAAALTYIAARAGQGFNVVHSMLLSEAGWGNAGGKPFVDLAAEKLNPAYWQEVDRRVAYANSRGIVCGLALAWGDKGRQEPFAWRKFANLEARKRYAQYIAARYGAFDTYFLVSGEWHAEIRSRGSTAEAVRQEFIEIGNTLREADPHGRMIGIHPMTSEGSVREFVPAAWMSFGDYQQNYHDLHARILQSRQANKPVVNAEYGYFLRDQSGDGVPDKDNSTSLAAMRHAAWDIAMAGGYGVTGFGTTYFGGNRDPGPFQLVASKNKPWEEQVGHIKAIFSELQWWKLQPHDELLTCDIHRGTDGKELGRTTPPAATYWCLADPGKAYVIYCRGFDSPLAITLQGARSAWSATRIDPRTGERTMLRDVTGATYTVQPPDTQDWVILLKPAGSSAVTLENGRWHINGAAVNSGSPAEGLLMNVRMVNSVFEDVNPNTRLPDFDADANTARFIAKIPDYAASGVNAFTICLQGGMPGFEGAVNSAFRSDGSLRPEYLARVSRVIEACDENGVAVILGCYYQRQSKILRDEEAVRAGVVNVARWIESNRWKNVLLEIANEYPHRGFVHPLIREPQGQASLIRLAKQTAPGLLVTASGLGDGVIHREVAEACDFLTPHWNGTKGEDIPARLATLKRFGKPIVVNEDDKTGEQAAAALTTTVENGAAYGLMLQKHNQHFPFHFDGAADDPVYYAALKKIAALPAKAKEKGSQGVQSYFPPPDDQGGWRRPATAAEEQQVAGIDRAKLDEAFAFIQGSTKNGGLVVVRNGWLVYERYFGKGHREATPNLASCGKSITSIAIGILLAERPDLFPDGLEQKVFTPSYLPPEAFPLSDPRKAEIKLGQLLAMTAGIRGNNPVYVNGKQAKIDPVGPDGSSAMVDAIALGKRDRDSNGNWASTATLWCNPGEGYSYATSSIHIASIMLRHVTGVELQEYVEQHLARPLGWGRWAYGYKTAREVTHTPGGGGIALRATDMARFGYLLLREGRWNEKQIVPPDFVRHCAHKSPYNVHFAYSLQFNLNPESDAPELPRDAFWKSGSGGHVLYIVPSLDLVVWKLGGRDEQYSPANTGLAMHPDAVPSADPRQDWKQIVEPDAALRKTLQLVISAIMEPQER